MIKDASIPKGLLTSRMKGAALFATVLLLVVGLCVVGTVFSEDDDSESSLFEYEGFMCKITSMKTKEVEIVSITQLVNEVPSNITFEDVEYTVTSIGPYAFKEAKCTSMVLPSTLETMGEGAFIGSSLQIVNIPEKVKVIPDSAFEKTKLLSVTIPSNVEAIGESAFAECSFLSFLTMEEGLQTIGSGAFGHCYNLLEIVIPESVRVLMDGAFSYCYALEKLTIPISLNPICDPCNPSFHNDYALRHITFTAGTGVGVDYTAYEGYDYKSNYVLVSPWHLSKSNIEEVTFSSGITHIGESMFVSMDSLENIVLPDTIETIGAGAFAGCYSLKNVDFQNCKNLKTIRSFAFNQCNNLESIDISSLDRIERLAFSDCIKLREVTIGDVDTIEYQAFDYCTKLERVSVSSVSNLEAAFTTCHKMTEFAVSKGDTINFAPGVFSETESARLVSGVPGQTLKLYSDKELTIEFEEAFLYSGSGESRTAYLSWV